MDITALQQSPFLQSLGWAIANSLWQAAALWIAYQIISGIYMGASARFKNNLSTILLLSVFVWFCITLFNKYFALQDVPVDQSQLFQKTGIGTSSIYSADNILNNISSVLPYLSIAYLFLLLFLFIRLINVYRFTNFIKINGLKRPSVEWKLFTEKVARQMGITKSIKLWISDHIDVPATIGFLKPVILIPMASINQLTMQQMEAVILHELSHIKRNDYLINLFISIIETILFFNPFVVLLTRVIKTERENCCDDFVIQYQYDRHTYASALLSLEQVRNIDLRLAIGATSGRKQLLLRIKRIMEIKSRKNFNYGQKLAALFFITALICSIAWLSPQSNNTNIKQSYSSKERAYESDNIKKYTPKALTPDNKEAKSTLVKPRSKKIIVETKRDLLTDINLKSKETINREAGSKNELRTEIQKEIISTTTTRSSSDGIEYNIDLKKLQSELGKLHFSFSFDEKELQNAITQAFKSKELSGMPVEKLIKRKIKNSIEHVKHFEALKHTPIPQYKERTLYLARLRATSNNRKISNAHILPKGAVSVKPPQVMLAYHDQNKISGFNYRTVTNTPPKRNVFRSKVQEKDNLQIVLKDGIIIINGERINLPDTKQILTQLKAEKLLPPDQSNMSLQLED